MFPLFSFLQGFLKISTNIVDNHVFRLHYRLTVVILAIFSLLVTCTQYFGNPIECLRGDVPKDFLNTFCWVEATFSVPGSWNKKVGVEVPYAGVDNYVHGRDERVFHAYYQWVCFVLFLQAILCYIPRFLWKVWEGGLVKNLVLGLNKPTVPKEERDDKKSVLVEYLYTHMNCHKSYVGRYIVCEVLNFVNILGQMYLIDKFLGGEFTSYGLEVMKFTQMDDQNRLDPMIRIFPRLTKCLFFIYGPSGSMEKKDALCLLPLNIINEKIYIFIWFWFIILAILSGFVLVYRILTAVSPQLRLIMLKSRTRFTNGMVIDSVMRSIGFGDWFLLYLLTKNLEPLHMNEVLVELSKELNEKPLLHRDYLYREKGIHVSDPPDTYL